MRVAFSPKLRIAAGLILAVLLSIFAYQIVRRRNPNSPEELLKRADKISWLNNWIGAAPIYRQAQLDFRKRGQASKALYAQVSQVPAHMESSTPLPDQIALLRHDLTLPAARNTQTRLRILTILGMLETNYDAGMAQKTWAKVESMALHQGHFLLASRAIGEQGIAAFLEGNIALAKKDVLRAWMVAKFADPAAHIRYASMYGTGLVQLKKYKQALGPLNQAIHVADTTPGVAYPTIAITSKIEALGGLGEYKQALALASAEMRKVDPYHLLGNLYELYQTRAQIYVRMGQWDRAISDYQEATEYAKKLQYWRGLVEADGLLARAYLHQGQLKPALKAIDRAIDENKKIPDELYFVPRNLAIKAEIMDRLGDISESNDLYGRSTDLLDVLLSRVPTPNIERQLLNDVSSVYTGYFTSLCRQGKLAEAFQVIEGARGRIEAQDLAHHPVVVPHRPTPTDQHLTRMSIELLNTAGKLARGRILNAIYVTENQLGDHAAAYDRPPHPVTIQRLQSDLHSSELFIEYVLAKPHSYALAITDRSVHLYTLASRGTLNREATEYRSELIRQKADPVLAQRLFNQLLGSIPEYRQKRDVIVVPGGNLDLLPFSALEDHGKFVLESHDISVAPSGTVFDMLRHRDGEGDRDKFSFLGVAAWTSRPPPATLIASIRRTFTGGAGIKPIALPASRYEVETAGDDLPKPRTILLGSQATVGTFENLPLGEYDVIHLALHGYVNPASPDESALVFAPSNAHEEAGYLRVPTIRQLHLEANLVTLSACNTGVGPVGEDGVDDIVNAFIDAGAQSVVSTLWPVEDQATAHFMSIFYQHLAKGESKSAALRQAQLSMLRSGASPYFWAGFELDGEPSEPVLHDGQIDLAAQSAQQVGASR